MKNTIHLVAAAATAAFLSTATASAQTAWIEVNDEDMVVDIVVVPRAYTVGDLEDLTVVGGNGETIGDVEEILVSADRSQVAIATEVGGFLGVGQRDVVVPLNNARVIGDNIVLDLTKEQIEALQDWEQ